jgi:hypothetical protein
VPILELLESSGSAYLLLDAYEQLLALVRRTALPEQAHHAADMFSHHGRLAPISI